LSRSILLEETLLGKEKKKDEAVGFLYVREGGGGKKKVSERRGNQRLT